MLKGKILKGRQEGSECGGCQGCKYSFWEVEVEDDLSLGVVDQVVQWDLKGYVGFWEGRGIFFKCQCGGEKVLGGGRVFGKWRLFVLRY